MRGGSASNAAAHDPALAEIIGVRLLLVNVLSLVRERVCFFYRRAGGFPYSRSSSPAIHCRFASIKTNRLCLSESLTHAAKGAKLVSSAAIYRSSSVSLLAAFAVNPREVANESCAGAHQN